MTVFAYVATSTPDLELLQQREKVEDHARQFELHVDRVFADSNVTEGVLLRKRPGGQELLAALKPGDVVVLAATAFGNPADFLSMITWWVGEEILPHVLRDQGEPVIVQPEFCSQVAGGLEKILSL